MRTMFPYRRDADRVITLLPMPGPEPRTYKVRESDGAREPNLMMMTPETG